VILTVTLNVALDVTYEVPELTPCATHRVTSVARRAGGKGINVARVLHQLGHETVASGYVGGVVGEEVLADLDAAGLPHRLVGHPGRSSRQSVTVVDRGCGDATVLNEPGPELTDDDWTRFLATYDELAPAASCVVLSGSLPPGLPTDAYALLCTRTPGATVVDSAGPALLAAARAGADVLLPNLAELRETTGRLDPIEGALALLDAGGKAVVVSMGAEGLLAITRDGCWRVPAVSRLSGNPTGAGDALAAAIGATTELPWPDRLRAALAWSAAAVPVPLAGEVDVATLHRVADAALVDELEDCDAAATDR